MFEKSVDKITSKFVKLVTDLDKLIAKKQSDISIYEGVRAEAQFNIDASQTEIIRAEKIKKNVEKLLDI